MEAFLLVLICQHGEVSLVSWLAEVLDIALGRLEATHEASVDLGQRLLRLEGVEIFGF